MELFVKVIINSTSYAIDRFFTYKANVNASDNIIGHRVIVPFGRGNKLVEGYVIDKLKPEEVDMSITYKYVKEFCDERPVLDDKNLQLVNLMKNKYLCTSMECIKLFLPVGLSKGMTFKKKKKLFVGKPLEGKFNKEPYLSIVERVKEVSLIKTEYVKKYNLSISSINTLIKNGHLEVSEEINWRGNNKLYERYEKRELNDVQKYALETILNSDDNKFLIHGVTGSGKTEIYLNLVEHMINCGKDSIVLVPEISLTPQMIERFKGRFGDTIAIFHSRLSPGARYDEWMRVRLGKVSVAVGARSALFLPFTNLGLIIIDEEHENSYKSESDPKYDARDVAYIMSELKNIKVVLGSATPSLESYYKTTTGELKLIEMKHRVAGRAFPNSKIIDMREELSNNNKSMFSKDLYNGIGECLKNGRQVILFLNRRGFSPFVSCRKCGYVFKCKNCDISLTYHKSGKMICHYCGYTENAVNVCPECKSKYVKYFGVGTERVEKEVKAYFKDARVIRMDYDTTRKKDSYETLYNTFKDRKADILIGTQMIAKGLDFENVTLVGVIAADLSLNNPDYRASERTFQLITQVSGRAGRGEQVGNVIIQTYSPENYSIQYACKNDYNNFYNEEIKIRETMNYPPFGKILLINISSIEKQNSGKYINDLNGKLQKFLQKYDKIRILGPSASTIFKLKNEYRWTVIIKGDVTEELALNVKNIVYSVLSEGRYKDIKIGLDINPNSFV